jgi:hypothetical protein
MMKHQHRRGRVFCSAALGSLFAISVFSNLNQAFGIQGAEDNLRGLWNDDFRQKGDLMLGVTAWRLRHSTTEDSERDLVHEGPSGPQRYIPERLAADSRLSEGDKVRISIEAAIAGFLYVVSREEYANGTYGKPQLIFPTGRIRGGKNAVQPGEFIEIPEWNNSTPYFTLRRSKPSETGEQLFLLLSKQRLAEIHTTGESQPLDPATLEDWTRKWGSKTRMLDDPARAGSPITPVEHDAAARGRRLTHSDPVPQFLFRSSNEGQDALLAQYTIRLRP